MRLFRLTQARDPIEAFDGTRAAESPGRWNVAGRPAVYTASSLALALLEIAVQSMSPSPPALSFYRIDIDDGLLERLDVRCLGDDWRSLGGRDACRRLGDAWRKRGTSVGLIVPSLVLPPSCDYGAVAVLNPRHPSFTQAVVDGPFA